KQESLSSRRSILLSFRSQRPALPESLASDRISRQKSRSCAPCGGRSKWCVRPFRYQGDTDASGESRVGAIERVTDANGRDPKYLAGTGFPIAGERPREGPHRLLTRVYPRQPRVS